MAMQISLTKKSGFEISGLEISILRAWAWPKLTYIHVYTYFALILGAATQVITPAGACSCEVDGPSMAPFPLPSHFQPCPTVLQELLRVWHPDKNPESCEVARSLRIRHNLNLKWE